jgi:hypothetical protein
MLGHCPISTAPLSTIKVRVVIITITTPAPSVTEKGGGHFSRSNKYRKGKEKNYLLDDEECILAIIKIFVIIEN